MDNLTKDAKRVISAAYAAYLKKMECGTPKMSAKNIQKEDLLGVYLHDITPRDYLEIRSEINRALGCTTYLDGSFVLPDSAIIYMENRFKNGIKDVLSFLAQFIP